jgi:uncharacterized repeat protein (TIGR03803 family)
MANLGQRQGWTSGIWIRASATLALAIVFVAITSQSAQAQTYQLHTLHNFKRYRGESPVAGVIRDSAGNLWGTTMAGGPNNSCVVFRLSPSNVYTILHNFAKDTACWAGLIKDSAGNLYGTTASSGNKNTNSVFELVRADKFKVSKLYNFPNPLDGNQPQASLIRDSQGNLYGTTYKGGASDWGVVFKVTSGGQEIVLHSFTNSPDGASPVSGLFMDQAGNLYGTTPGGGTGSCQGGCGTVFEIDSTGTETILHSFTGAPDGMAPVGKLIADAQGNLYGTTVYGGTRSPSCVDYGCGTVFKVDTTGAETVLYSFTGNPDGAWPEAGLTMDSAGNLYGETEAGGEFGVGTVFELDTELNETVIYAFSLNNGYYPVGGVILDGKGNLYGTTLDGGSNNYGMVFKLTP